MSLTITFRSHGAGWIDITLTTGSSQITVEASYVYDPFPMMLDWLEKIIDGQMQSELVVDEERTLVEFTYRSQENATGQLDVVDICNAQRRITLVISPYELVSTFYRSFRAFVESPEYQSEQWEELTLGEYLVEQLSVSEEELLQRLSHYPSRALRQLIWHVNPQYQTLAPEGAKDETHISYDENGSIVVSKWGSSSTLTNENMMGDLFAFVEKCMVPDYSHDPVQAVAHEQSIAIPVYVEIASEYESSSFEKRIQLLAPLMTQRMNFNSGSKLRKLRSNAIEEWLD